MSINHPDIDWIDMACGVGVEDQQVCALGALGHTFDGRLSHQGPYLIDLET